MSKKLNFNAIDNVISNLPKKTKAKKKVKKEKDYVLDEPYDTNELNNIKITNLDFKNQKDIEHNKIIGKSNKKLLEV